MFTAKQKKLMTVLGIVSDHDQVICHEGYLECACEMRANGMGTSSFTAWLEHKVRVAEFIAQRNAQKSLKQLA